MDLYFAYGSNMSCARLERRVRPVRALGAARLRDMAWRCNKRGADGSAKANLVREPGGAVWGVIFELDASAWPELDRFEGGYRRIRVRVEAAGGDPLAAQTYASERLIEDARPTEDYRRFLIEGAREHGLPEFWRAMLETLPALPAPPP